MNLQTFISFAEQVFETFLQLSIWFGMPMRKLSTIITISPNYVEMIIKLADRAGMTWLGNLTIFEIVFSSGTLLIIIVVGLVRWVLDILP